ncbi:MAG: hypothetical protein Q9167_001449 [Letrouitia subvulpina]
MSESFPLSSPYPIASTLVIDTSNPVESLFGYHRAVRKGPFIFVSGTTALLSNNTVAFPNDFFAQAKAAFEIAVAAVEKLGGYTKAVGEAFTNAFQIKHEVGAEGRSVVTGVAATMIVTGKESFVDNNMLVEVEIDALV